MDNFQKWLTAKGFEADDLGAQELAALQQVFDTETERDPIHASREELAGDVERVASIAKIAARHPELHAKAIRDGWGVEKTELEVLRATRPTAEDIRAGGRAYAADSRVLEAKLLMHFGHGEVAEKSYDANTCQQADDLSAFSMVDLCAHACRIDGIEPSRNRHDMVRAAMSTSTLPTALGNTMNKVIEQFYMDTPASWRAYCAIRRAENFKAHTNIRPSFLDPLEELPPDGEIKHGELAESTFSWTPATYAKQYRISRKDFINDDGGIFDQIAPALGNQAGRKIADVAATTLLDAGSFFHADNNNLLTGAGSALSVTSVGDAIEKLRRQVDSEGNNVPMIPTTLLVGPENEQDAKAILESDFLQRLADSTATSVETHPTGNSLKGSLRLEVESRLSNTDKFTNASTTLWYMFARPLDVAFVAGFLDGRQSPVVEFFGLDSDVNTLGMSWRCYIDAGFAAGDFRAAVKSDGA